MREKIFLCIIYKKKKTEIMMPHKNGGAQAILRILQTKDNNIMSNKPKANNKGHLQKKLRRPQTTAQNSIMCDKQKSLNIKVLMEKESVPIQKITLFRKNKPPQRRRIRG